METFLRLTSIGAAVYCGLYMVAKAFNWFDLSIIDMLGWCLEHLPFLLFVGSSTFIIWYSFIR